MDFSEESFRQLEEWWAEHGNSDIDILPRFDDQIMFYNKVKRRETARITKWGNGPSHLEFGQPQSYNPFNAAEKEQINKFMKANNETPTIACEYCGTFLELGDGYYEWDNCDFCCKDCVARYIIERTYLVEHVVGEDDD